MPRQKVTKGIRPRMPAPKKNGMDAARKAIANLKAGEFSNFLQQIENETEDHQLKRYLYALFLEFII